MLSWGTVNGVSTIMFDTQFAIASDWLNLSEGIWSFADTLTINISNDSVLLVTKHEFQSNAIGFHGKTPVAQGVITGATTDDKFASLLAHLVARGDITLG